MPDRRQGQSISDHDNRGPTSGRRAAFLGHPIRYGRMVISERSGVPVTVATVAEPSCRTPKVTRKSVGLVLAVASPSSANVMPRHTGSDMPAFPAAEGSHSKRMGAPTTQPFAVAEAMFDGAAESSVYE